MAEESRRRKPEKASVLSIFFTDKKNVEGKEGKYLEKDNTFVNVGVGLLKWFNLKMWQILWPRIEFGGQSCFCVQDGRLVIVKKWLQIYNGKMKLVVIFRDSITIDKQGIVFWNFMWSVPTKDMKFTKVMLALRVFNEQT